MYTWQYLTVVLETTVPHQVSKKLLVSLVLLLLVLIHLEFILYLDLYFLEVFLDLEHSYFLLPYLFLFLLELSLQIQYDTSHLVYLSLVPQAVFDQFVHSNFGLFHLLLKYLINFFF